MGCDSGSSSENHALPAQDTTDEHERLPSALMLKPVRDTGGTMLC